MTGDPLSSPLLRPGAARERDGEEPCLPRLRWRCRRGLLELDLALQAFLDRGYIALDPCERAAFRRLLDTSDVQLQAWLLGQEEAPEYEFRELIKKIR